MSEMNPLELHTLRLGKLVSNLQMIEMGARLAIASRSDPEAARGNTLLPRLVVGESVGVTALTSPEGLRKTLQDYNAAVPLECKVEIDPIVELRDALAHGRVFGVGPVSREGVLRLVKFDKDVKNGQVRVAMAIEMTETWSVDRIEFLHDQLNKVQRALDWDSTDLSG